MKRRNESPLALIDHPSRFDPEQVSVLGGSIDAGAGSVTFQSDSIIAGYRVIRLLGTGERALVYLGYSGSGTAVALKVFRAGTGSASIESDLAVLTSAAAPGLVRLLDVAQLGDGRICLVLERLAGGSLARYLIEQPRLTPGEVVTVLAPIVVTLQALHSADFALGSLSQATVLLDATGRPILTGFGALRQFGDAPRERMPLLRADYGRLAVVGQGLCNRLDEADQRTSGGASVLQRFRAAVDAASPSAVRPGDSERSAPGARAESRAIRSVLGDLEHDLFDWADGEPLRGFRPAPRPRSPRPENLNAGPQNAPVPEDPGPCRYVPDESDSYEHVPDDHDRERSGRAGSAGDTGSGALITHHIRLGARAGALQADARQYLVRPRALLYRLLDTLVDAHPVEFMGSGLRKRLRGRRLPVVVGGLFGVSLLVLALTLIPVTEPSGQSGWKADAVAPSTSAAVSAPVDADRTSGQSDAQAGAPVSGLETPDPEAIAGDDPVAAVLALLRERASCLSAASLVCLVGVDQTGSAVLALDSYDVRQRQQGGSAAAPPDYAGLVPTLAERTGNLAVVALTPPAGDERSQPASVLVVKGEGGWRLREIFDY